MTISDDLRDEDPDSFIRDVGAGELHLRKRISVGILGATGNVGQRLISLLSNHRWFEITALCASEKSQGKTYQEAVSWRMPEPIPEKVRNMEVTSPKAPLPCHLVFSALDGAVAGDIETEFAKAGYPVISCAKSHRMDDDVPLLIPEVNSEHLELVKTQKYSKKGFIVTKPNCSAIGLALALRPLQLEFGVEEVHVVTLQALSGAGFPGVPSLAITDNVIPYISGEEERVELEPKKILGTIKNNKVEPYPIKISASCTRVPVTEGHLEVVSVKLKEKAKKEELIRAWKEFWPPSQELKLPTACAQVIHYFSEDDFPQPRLHRDLENGMALSIGRLRACPILDYKFVLLSHNTIRGAAGGAILMAELLIKRGHIYW